MSTTKMFAIKRPHSFKHDLRTQSLVSFPDREWGAAITKNAKWREYKIQCTTFDSTDITSQHSQTIHVNQITATICVLSCETWLGTWKGIFTLIASHVGAAKNKDVFKIRGNNILVARYWVTSTEPLLDLPLYADGAFALIASHVGTTKNQHVFKKGGGIASSSQGIVVRSLPQKRRPISPCMRMGLLHWLHPMLP